MNPDVKQLLSRVMKAKEDSEEADALIADYLPFIRSETAKFLHRQPEPDDDELSIAMFAFYEAICSYSRLRGAFLKYAALQIRSRLIDDYRREKRNRGVISLNETNGEETELLETLADPQDEYAAGEMRDAVQTEIAELTVQMTEFGLRLTDIAENAPQQEKTRAACQRAVRYARANPELLTDFLRTRRVPLAKLAEGAPAERKTLERHRKYLAAVLLICTNGYEILRDHISQVLHD